MTKETYLTIAIIAAVTAVIGLVSFMGGVRPVNIGAFIFPLLIAILAFYKYKR